MTKAPQLVACLLAKRVATRCKRRVGLARRSSGAGFPPARAAMSRAATSTMHQYFSVRTRAADYQRHVAGLDREMNDVVRQLANLAPDSADEAAALEHLADLAERSAELVASGRGERVANAIKKLIVHVVQVRRDHLPCTQTAGRARSRARIRRRRCSASCGSRSSGDDGDGGEPDPGHRRLLAGGCR